MLGSPMPVRAETGSARFEPGDTLAIYTDGVVELAEPGGAEFGPARLESLLRRTSGAPASQVVNAVVRETLDYAGRSSYEDDFTLMIVRRDG